MLDAPERHAVYVLKADVEARGIEPHTLIAGVRTADYAGFVDLAVQNDHVRSWL